VAAVSVTSAALVVRPTNSILLASIAILPDLTMQSRTYPFPVPDPAIEALFTLRTSGASYALTSTTPIRTDDTDVHKAVLTDAVS